MEFFVVEVGAHTLGQEPGSLEAALLPLGDEVGGEDGAIAIQETDDTFLVALGKGCREDKGRGKEGDL